VIDVAAHPHYSWEELRQQWMAEPGFVEAYEAAGRAIELGETVRKLRQQRGWSTRKLARAAGMTQSALDDLELGGPLPPASVLERLAAVLEANFEVRITPRNRSEVS
jgi:ribosome-binding protein aMBF1 (putative translation factor)